MQLGQLLQDVTYELLQGTLEQPVTDLVYDSRKAAPGKVFVCLSGAVTDGHNYIAGAIEAGTTAVIVEKDVPMTEGITYLKVQNTRKALSYTSQTLFQYPARKLTLVGLTGTKGKTTTSFMMKEILEQEGKKVGVIGTMGVYIGSRHIPTQNTTPESYEIQYFLSEMVKEKVDVAVMEVSSQALKLDRVAGMEFDYGVFTNLTPDHIGEHEHKDMQEYIFCKSLLFRQCREGVFNRDDKHFDDMVKNASCQIHTYGLQEGADLWAEQIAYRRETGFIGIDFVTGGQVEEEFKVNTPGKFTAYNALSAILLTSLMGAQAEAMKHALYHFAVRGRVEPVRISDRYTLLIDYAHNAVSMESLLTTIREYEPKRIVSMFGCGGNRSKLRRFEMGEISGKLADLSVLTADNSRFEDVMDIIEDIKVGMAKTDGAYVVIPDRREAMKYCIEHAQDGDIILFLGKGHEDYQEIQGVKYPFDERDVIADILKEQKSASDRTGSGTD